MTETKKLSPEEVRAILAQMEHDLLAEDRVWQMLRPYMKPRAPLMILMGNPR